MSRYGFQCYDAQGRLTCDNSSIMSQVQGVFDLPFISEGGWIKSPGDLGTYKYTRTVTGLNFSNGTPYVFFIPVIRNVGPRMEQGFALPNVTINVNSIVLEYDYLNLSYPDDTSFGVEGGGLTMVWGVYNA